VIDFPASPSIGQTFTDPTTNLEWVWDGTKWIASGLADAPFQPLFGVIDGSNAVAGQIGEVISNVVTAGVSMAAAGVAYQIASIALGPGDWDISGFVTFTPGAATMTGMQAAINVALAIPAAVSLATSRALIAGLPASSGVQVLSLSTCRANLTAASTTYYLIATAAISSGSPAGTGVIWARRAR
jgi:hypothetical protein